ASALGKGHYFPYTSAEEIFNELREASRGGIADYAGITYDRLRREGGIQWPCPEADHPGTGRLFEHSFAHPDHRAELSVIPNEPAVQKEKPSAGYPLYLTTGRVMSHY
ncbi:nitrite reductase, partial [Cupriavidus sp. SIMBA_020]